MCVGVHTLCIAKGIHRHGPRRFMWVYVDRAHTVCVYLHPQRIRVMHNADVCESWSASMPLTHPVWKSMRGCPWVSSNRFRGERSLRI